MTSLFYLDWTRSAHGASLFSNRSIKRELKFRVPIKMEFHSVSRRICMNTDRKILLPRAEVVEKNNSMNAVVYQSRVSIIQWIETMQRVSTIAIARSAKRLCSSILECLAIWKKITSQLISYERRWYIRANCDWSCHAIKGRGEIAWHNRPT